MLVVVFLTTFIILGGISVYIFYFAPKLNPSNRAQELLKENKITDAILEYNKILDENPYDFVINFRVAELLLKIEKFDQAALNLERILDINKFNYEVEKINVEKKLAKIYQYRGETEKSFELYVDIVATYPSDETALYNVAFLCLGQEEFDIAQKYFERLVKIKKKDFDVSFGAGICSYQNQKINECVEFFKTASSLTPESEIANLAMVFAYFRKMDYRKVQGYLEKLLKTSEDPQVKFIVLRLEAFLNVSLKKNHDALSKFEGLLAFVKSNDMIEEINLTLYDLGYAALNDEQSKKAYDYWNELDQLQKNFKNIGELIMALRKEMDDSDSMEFEQSVFDKIPNWSRKAFHKDFLWEICGLKSREQFDVRKYMAVTVTQTDSGIRGGSLKSENISSDSGANLIETFVKLDNDSFRIISNRALEKMGYKIDQILNTYRDPDGVDFLGKSKENGDLVFMGVRRWTKTKVGEIPLRNFAQIVNDHKAKKGVFVSTADLTEGALNSLQNLSKVDVIEAEEFNRYLQGLM